jgi:hypothetical protein
MIRVIVFLVFVIVLVYFATQVQLGKHSLVGHVRAIWHTEEVKDLKDGVREKTAPAVERLERGVKAGVHAANRGSADGSAEAEPAK